MALHTETIECLSSFGEEPNACQGVVEYRTPLSGSGRAFPRCDRHWAQRLESEEQLRRRYPVSPPADWSPMDAGEAWDEQDY